MIIIIISFVHSYIGSRGLPKLTLMELVSSHAFVAAAAASASLIVSEPTSLGSRMFINQLVVAASGAVLLEPNGLNR